MINNWKVQKCKFSVKAFKSTQTRSSLACFFSLQKLSKKGSHCILQHLRKSPDIFFKCSENLPHCPLVKILDRPLYRKNRKNNVFEEVIKSTHDKIRRSITMKFTINIKTAKKLRRKAGYCANSAEYPDKKLEKYLFFFELVSSFLGEVPYLAYFRKKN